MKLLNLWPQGNVVLQPVKRFIQEVVFAVLLAVAATLAVWLWFNWRVDHATKTHQVLVSEWERFKQEREPPDHSGSQVPRYLRQIISGELDWMGELPMWSQDGRVRWLSAKMEIDSLLLEGIARDGDAIQTLANQIRSHYSEPPVSISEVTSITVGGEKWWRFSMIVNGVDLKYRWILKKDLTHTNPPPSALTGQTQSDPKPTINVGGDSR